MEAVRLGIDASEPVAVQQWGSLLAVNYPARAFSVKRGDSIHEAKKKCPNIHLPHVETLGDSEKQFDRNYQKASLKRYRDASAQIFAIFTEYANTLEKASIDEVYLDVSDFISQQVEQVASEAVTLCALALCFERIQPTFTKAIQPMF